MTFAELDFSKTYSYADYLTWKFQERVELIKGKLFKMSPAPSRRHQEVLMQLIKGFMNALDKNPCKVYTAPFDVRLPKTTSADQQVYTVVQPDLCVICDLEKLDDRGCIGAPDLVVEILSPGNTTKEMQNKFDLYEEAGVREYWIVHPTDHNVLSYVLNEEGNYLGQRPRSEGEHISPIIFPELSIDLTEIFAE